MESFAEMVESVEKETPNVNYKLIQSGLGYGGEEEKTRAVSEDPTVCLAKFMGYFRKEVYSLEWTAKGYIEDYWGLDGWEGLDLEVINNWDEFFGAIENHPGKTELYKCLNDQNFVIYKGGNLIMGSLDILKKVHELDPNILDKKVPFNIPIKE